MNATRWYVSLVLLLVTFLFIQRDFDDAYNRPIIGDAKAYYAYLPALFIYQDFTYSFVDEIEDTYYLKDGSLSKDFKVRQPNGTYVNKTFPGAALFYLPFFLVAMVLSWLTGLPVDGYSVLFQWSIVAAHLFYFLAALVILDKFMALRGIAAKNRIASLLMITLTTNVFFYMVYDHSVVHIFGFFGCSLLLFLTQKGKEQNSWKYVGYVGIVMAVMLLTRPTNAMMLFFVPLVYPLRELVPDLKREFRWREFPFHLFAVAAIVLFLAPLLWKIQTGNWIVYSYGDEKLNLLQPNLMNFLFSYKKGWLLWSPALILMLVGSLLWFMKRSRVSGFLFMGVLFSITYVFSSWWIWTYGMGMGQRTMIDYYPVLVWGMAGFLALLSKKAKIGVFAMMAFLAVINMVQAFQIHRFILVGGETTKETYWEHFLQLKTDPPKTIIPPDWSFVEEFWEKERVLLNGENHFSKSIELTSLPENPAFEVQVNLGGQNRKSSAMIVMSDQNGGWYHAEYPANFIYKTPRAVSYLFIPDKKLKLPVKCYIWNGDTSDEVLVEELKVSVYSMRAK